MGWEIILLGALILTIGTSAIIMASKTKSNQTGKVDIELLAKRVAEEVGEKVAIKFANELRDVLYSIPSQGRKHGTRASKSSQSEEVIEMDESVMPVKLDTSNIESNLEGMAKEEQEVDKELDKSKSKLRALLGKKDK